MSNELRRIKKKLELFDMEALNWLLCDLIEIINKDEGDGNWTEDGKQWLITKLRNEYKEYIQQNSPENKKQGELF